jgi:hypothetical protein
MKEGSRRLTRLLGLRPMPSHLERGDLVAERAARFSILPSKQLN